MKKPIDKLKNMLIMIIVIIINKKGEQVTELAMSNMMERHSKQRDAVLANLRGRKDHPTAQDVFFSLKPEMPALSLATVYRNLSMLANKGEIIRLQTAGEEHFDGDTSNHSHFFCTVCNKIYDVFSVDEMQAQTQKELQEIGTVTYQRLIYYGVCRECEQARR